MENDWKKRLGVVYSTNQDFKYDSESKGNGKTVPAAQQTLYVSQDRKNRKGKAVTLVSNFKGSEEELKELGKRLKTKCGVGGSIKDGEILLQGDHRKKVQGLLQEEGFKVKISGS